MTTVAVCDHLRSPRLNKAEVTYAPTADITLSAVSPGFQGSEMRRTSRLFELIQALRGSRRPRTATDLAEQLEVCRRTIYRDVASLQAMGVPIRGEAGVGYVIDAGFDLPPLMFSIEEVEAVVVALCLLQRTGDAGLKIAAGTLLGKIQDVIPKSVRGPLVTDSLYATSYGPSPIMGADAPLVRQAIREERKMLLNYSDAAGEVTSRLIMPIALVYDVEAQMIVAWCELRNAFRRFRTDRVQSCSLVNERFHGKGDTLRRLWQTHLGFRNGEWSTMGIY